RCGPRLHGLHSLGQGEPAKRGQQRRRGVPEEIAGMINQRVAHENQLPRSAGNRAAKDIIPSETADDRGSRRRTRVLRKYDTQVTALALLPVQPLGDDVGAGVPISRIQEQYNHWPRIIRQGRQSLPAFQLPLLRALRFPRTRQEAREEDARGGAKPQSDSLTESRACQASLACGSHGVRKGRLCLAISPRLSHHVRHTGSIIGDQGALQPLILHDLPQFSTMRVLARISNPSCAELVRHAALVDGIRVSAFWGTAKPMEPEEADAGGRTLLVHDLMPDPVQQIDWLHRLHARLPHLSLFLLLPPHGDALRELALRGAGLPLAGVEVWTPELSPDTLARLLRRALDGRADELRLWE